MVAFAATYFLTGAALVAVVPACAAASIPRAYFGRRRIVRLRELQAAWPDGLRDVVASVAAGRSLSHALTTLAETGPPALRDAFGRFPLLARMLGTVPALEIVKADLADPTSDRVIEVLILAQERGGPIVRRILEDLVVATTKDLKVLDEIETEGLEMKINARAVLVMPWLVLVALDAPRRSVPRLLPIVRPAYWWWSSPRPLSVVGSWWISRLGRAHEEQRVFAGGHPLDDARVIDPAVALACVVGRRGRGRCRGARRATDPQAGAARPAVHRDRARARLGREADLTATGAGPASTSGDRSGCSVRPGVRSSRALGRLLERRHDETLALHCVRPGTST